MNATRKLEHGAIDGKVFGIVILSILFIAAGSAAIWAYMNYSEAKANVDSKVEAAAAEAVKNAKEESEKAFLAREKEPMRQFTGLDDYGRVTFDYPKTWSVYQQTSIDSSGDAYAVYFNPIQVPPVPENALNDLVASSKETPSKTAVSKFAVRLKIESKTYDQSLKSYEPLLKTNQLKSSPFTGKDGITGTQFEGRFNGDIRGKAVVMKLRDRTLTMRTDADVFLEDFNKLLQTVDFNK